MLLDDVLHAWRRIRSRPATIVGAAAMLALAIALTTAMFTLADALLLSPVPFPGSDRLARVSMMGPRGGRVAVSPGVLDAWRALTSFEAVESATTSTVVLESGGGLSERTMATVTPGLFHMLAVRPLRGRLFDAQDGAAGAGDRVLISEDLWRAAFGSDPATVGRDVVIDGVRVHVVGVLPGGFRFLQWDTVIWRATSFNAAGPAPAVLPIAYVRFAAALPRADALRLATEAAHVVDPATAKLAARDDPLTARLVDEYQTQALPWLLGGVALVFVVLCANVSSLLLVRLAERRREFSMCAVLGASRSRLLRQALVESAAIGAACALAGIALAAWLVAVARAFLPQALVLRSLNPLDLDLRALGAAAIAGAFATVVAGVWPAWLATRRASVEVLHTGARTVSDSRTTRLVTRGLVVAETMLACTLMIGAVLLVRSFVNLSRSDRGLDASGVMSAWIALATDLDAAARLSIGDEVERELWSLAGVTDVARSYGLPPGGAIIHRYEDWRSDTPGSPALSLEVESYADVSQRFFELYQIPILRGRGFQAGDRASEVAVVGERLARLLWGETDPVGRTFSFGKSTLRVIGVAREIHYPSTDARVDRPEFYTPRTAAPANTFMVSLRCADTCPDPATLRQRLTAISPAVRVQDVGPIEARFTRQLSGPRAAAALGAAFAAIGVIASAGGLFGVLSYAVNLRRREFGVRAAVGASARQLRAAVMADGLGVAAAGIALGCVAGWWLARSLSAFHYGVTASDPLSWASVVATLVVATLAAVWRPALLASRTDPSRLLREE